MNSERYLCPFCVSSWDCDGPHIEEKDLDSYYERLDYMRKDLALLATEVLSEYELETNQSLLDLKNRLYKRLTERSMN